jgi:hypothetical protein
VHLLLGGVPLYVRVLEVPSCPINILSHCAHEAAIGTPCQLNYIKTSTQHVLRITRPDRRLVVLPVSPDGLVWVAVSADGSILQYVEPACSKAVCTVSTVAGPSGTLPEVPIDWVYEGQWEWGVEGMAPPDMDAVQRITLAQQMAGVTPDLFETGQLYINRAMIAHKARRASVPAGRTPAAGGAPTVIPPSQAAPAPGARRPALLPATMFCAGATGARTPAAGAALAAAGAAATAAPGATATVCATQTETPAVTALDGAAAAAEAAPVQTALATPTTAAGPTSPPRRRGPAVWGRL